MKQPTSLFDRFINRPHPIWATLLVSVVVLVFPFLGAYLDGSLEQFIQQGQWRTILFAPTIALYIWIITPHMTRAGENVISALRPLVGLNDQDFHAHIYAAEQIKPGHEIAAVAAGMLLGIAAIATDITPVFSWVTLYWFISTILMYGMLAWTIFLAVNSTRFNAALHRLPLQFDILNPKPFEAVGRQSLLLALVFIGGITLSLLFTYSEARLAAPEFWISNLIFIAFIVLIFFLSMRPTHLILAAEKKQILEPVTQRINASCRELVQLLEDGKDPGELTGQISALVAYEQRLVAARTWPYNVTILRTLFFSVFIPLVSILARVAVDLIFP
jgi:hypothetical protein